MSRSGVKIQDDIMKDSANIIGWIEILMIPPLNNTNVITVTIERIAAFTF